MADLPQWALDVTNRYGPEVAKLLGVPMIPVTIQEKPPSYWSDRGIAPPAAQAVGGVISLNEDWFKANPSDEGAIVHELTHVYMRDTGNIPAQNWFQEGLADYVRDKLGLSTAESHAQPGGSARGSYQETAAFLKWVEAAIPGSVAAVAAAVMMKGETPSNALQAATGTPTKQLVMAYNQNAPAPSPGPTTGPTDPGAIPGSTGTPSAPPPPGPTAPPAAPPAPPADAPPRSVSEGTGANAGEMHGGISVPAATSTIVPGSIDLSGAGVAAVMSPWEKTLRSLFQKDWGQPPPQHWVDAALAGKFGDTSFEVDLHERAKPAFQQTQTARDEQAAYARTVASALGLR